MTAAGAPRAALGLLALGGVFGDVHVPPHAEERCRTPPCTVCLHNLAAAHLSIESPCPL